MRLEIYPFAHVFRAGSKVRIIITAPGGDRMTWAFDTLAGTPTNEIARTVGRPSSVALPGDPRRVGAHRSSHVPWSARSTVPALRGAYPACLLITCASPAVPWLVKAPMTDAVASGVGAGR